MTIILGVILFIVGLSLMIKGVKEAYCPETDTLPQTIVENNKVIEKPHYRVAKYDNGKFRLQYLSNDDHTYFDIGPPDEFIDSEDAARRYCAAFTERYLKRNAKIVEILEPR